MTQDLHKSQPQADPQDQTARNLSIEEAERDEDFDEDLDEEEPLFSEEDDEDGEEFEDTEQGPAAPPNDLDSEEKVRLMAEAADAVKAEDITILDLRQLTIIADFFMLCTGKSSIQIRAIADRIEEKLRDAGIRKLRIEGYQEATWVLMDYGDVVVHVMAAEQRAFYRLEDLWGDAPRVEFALQPQ